MAISTSWVFVLLVVKGDMMSDNKLKVYRDVWQKLYDEILNEKTSWGKEELKKQMDKMLIEEMEKYL